MNLAKLIEYLRNRLKTVVRVCCAVLAFLVLLDVIRALMVRDPQHPGENWPAFWSVFGFLGCVILIIGSKWFGHAGIMQPEDYYEKKAPGAPEESDE